ncbi:RNA-directed DNA polymerase, eukaryota, reverse transcriptase zinc-binding domain protein [Tanacetum coccineum]
MTIHLRRSRRRVRVPVKYGDTFCALNDKQNDQTMNNEQQLQNNSSDDGIENLGEISRVCGNGDGSNQKNNMDEGLKCVDNEAIDSSKQSNVESNVESGSDESNKQSIDDGAQSTKVPITPMSMPVNVQASTVKTCMDSYDDNKYKSSYIDKVNNTELNDENKLDHIPTVINDDGLEFVVFDDDLVKEGSKRWELSACGYFVGYRMSIQELRYHLYRMWSKFGLKHILNNGNGVFVFKFDNLQGLQKVIESGPWIIKLMNPPLEAWSVKGLSALASRIVGVHAKKGLVDSIDVLYKSKESSEQYVKKVRVEYDWKPPVCSHYGVFRHINSRCAKLGTQEGKVPGKENVNEGFINVNKKKINGAGKTNNVQQNNRRGYMENRNLNQKYKYRQKSKKEDVNIVENMRKQVHDEKFVTPPKTHQKTWNVEDTVIKDIRSTTNKFAILQEVEEEGLSLKLNKQKKEEVGRYAMMKLQPSFSATSKWTKEMKEYFKEKWDKQYRSESYNEGVCSDHETDIELDENDVYVDKSGTASFMNENENSKGCRIPVGWDANNVNCSLVNDTPQSMLYKVEVLSTKKTFYCTFIYAANKGKDKRYLWKELILNKRLIGDSAWVLMGDVNVSLNLEDHSEGMSNYTQDMIEFQECVNEIETEDINCSGMHFTWTKSLLNPNATVLKKIDRIMGNSSFFAKFSTTNAIFLPYGISDHSPAILKIPQAMIRKRKSFRLANYVTDKREFTELVKDKWNTEVQGHAMYRLVSKLKGLKQHLNKLNWKNGNLNENVVLLREYKEASMDEEKLLRQKAKITWLREGDKNSAYFHKVLKGRINRNRIMSVCAEDGIRYENCEVATQFVKHFEGFLGINPPVTKLTVDENYLFNRKISETEANKMIREVSDDEIKIALFDIDDDKAPGPDGYTSKFYKKAWNVVKGDFCAAIKEFFFSGKLLGEINATFISLVPKSMTPQKVSDFRPIACCNVTYKCISKILTNRIKVALNQVVEENQSAFVLGRAITDNILLSQELLKGYSCINGPKRYSFKIDIRKAYDTVNWGFIEDILRQFGFPNLMIGWIMTCISTLKFTICVNGERFGYFKGERRLRQGDPISPYIFTMVMKMLNLMVKDEIRKEKAFKFHFGCKKLRITHLCFTDDLLMFSHGNRISVLTLKRALDKFSAISGLHLNLRKCTMFCESLDDDTKNEICSIFLFKEAKLPLRYLGVPLVTKMIGVSDCKQMVDKGSIFLLPKTIINDIEKLFKKFLWNNGDSGKGRAKVAWLDVCKPKDQGGLGFKSLEIWNKTLLVKHLWNIAANKESLWVKWVNVVKLKHRSIWDIDVDTKDSWGWKCLLNLRSWIGDHMRYKIGNGKMANVWHDKWYKDISLSSSISKKEVFYVGFHDYNKVSDLIDDNEWRWPHGNSSWEDRLTEMSKGCEKQNIWVVIRKLCLAAAVYYIWHEINSRLFNNCKREVTDCFATMIDEIRARMVSITVKESRFTALVEYQLGDALTVGSKFSLDGCLDEALTIVREI